jgi:hypothetical protein
MRSLAYANVALHVFGLLLGATAMRPGSIAAPLDERTAHLAAHPALWGLGWGVWMLSALAFVAFMERVVRHAPAARLALVLGAMGAGADLLCDALQMSVLPQFAHDERLFLALERIANLGGLVVANGLYSLAVLVATLELRGHLVAALGSATFVAGALMVAGGLLDAPPLVVLSAGPTILAYCGWVIAVKDETAGPRA